MSELNKGIMFLYTIEEEEVLDWLAEHAQHMPLLLTLGRKLQQFFEVVELVLTRTEGGLRCMPWIKNEGKEAAHIMREFNNDWWIEASYDADHKIQVLLGFI